MDLRYPIGKFAFSGEFTHELRAAWISDIEALPNQLREAVKGLNKDQLDTPYREGGWTVRQVVHHAADSHLNAYVRFKLALTEENPTIKPYFEDRFAELEDGKSAPIDISLSLLDSLHKRWVMLLRSMSESDFQRTFIHPESNKTITLDYSTGLYSWHGRHHTAHITSLRSRNEWV